MSPRGHRAPTRESPLDPESVGARIRALRKARGWSQDTLAQKAGTTQPQISEIERGYNEKPESATLIRIAEVFGVTPSELYERSRFPGIVLASEGLRNEIRSSDAYVQRTLESAARFLNRGGDAGQLSHEDVAMLEILLRHLQRQLRMRNS